MFTLTSFSSPSRSATMRSSTGETAWHGPHHSAQKSTRTGVSLPRTSCSKVDSVTAFAIPDGPFVGVRPVLPRRKRPEPYVSSRTVLARPRLAQYGSRHERRRDAGVHALRRRGRGGLSLLPVVRDAAAPQGGRVLPRPPGRRARPRESPARLALPRPEGAARALQRLERPRRRRGRRLARRARGRAPAALPRSRSGAAPAGRARGAGAAPPRAPLGRRRRDAPQFDREPEGDVLEHGAERLDPV